MENLKALLRLQERSGLSVEQIGVALGVSGRTISRWVSGQAQPSRLAELAIRQFLNEFKSAGHKDADL